MMTAAGVARQRFGSLRPRDAPGSVAQTAALNALAASRARARTTTVHAWGAIAAVKAKNSKMFTLAPARYRGFA
jgi:hypothetical protein